MRSCRAYLNWSEIDQSGHQKRLVEEQIGKNREYYDDLLLAQKAVLEQDMRYEQAGLERDSLLMEEGAISRAEYEATLNSRSRGRTKRPSTCAASCSRHPN